MSVEITAEKFRERTGNEPIQDDLLRCNCRDAGKIGHYFCGWCEACDKPRYVCGHFVTSHMRLFYLSFVNIALPKGQQFVGATIVEADSDKAAFERARVLKLVPDRCETAIMALWTQTKPQVEIVSVDQLPEQARPLYNTFTSREVILAQAHRQFRYDQEEVSVVCTEHS